MNNIRKYERRVNPISLETYVYKPSTINSAKLIIKDRRET